MNSNSKFERGAAIYGRLMGLPQDQVPTAMAERVGGDFVTEVLTHAGGLGWSSPALTDRDRAVATITALVALGIGSDRLASHGVFAQRAGLTEEALTALMDLLSHYLGYPRASTALEVIRNATTA